MKQGSQSPNNKTLSFFYTISKDLAILVLVLSILAIIGWKLDILFLKGIEPWGPVISPTASLCFFLAGLSLLLSGKEINFPTKKKLVRIFAALFFLAGLFQMFEYFLGFGAAPRIEIIRFIFGSAAAATPMSPAGAVSFILLGAAIFFIDAETKISKWLTQILSIGFGLIAFFALLGHVYNVPILYAVASLKGMSLQTTISFFVCFLAIFCARPERGLMKIVSDIGISGYITRRLLFTLALVLAIDILVVLGYNLGYYDQFQESVIRAVVMTGLFLCLILIGFKSIKKIQALEEVNRVKSEFVSFVAHQLRIPLVAIRWNIEAMIDDVPKMDYEQKRRLLILHHDAKKMLQTVDAFLNVSRIEIGAYFSEARKMNLSEAAESIIGELSSEVQAKNLNLVREYDNKLLDVFVDPKLVEVVLQNLLSNAVKYTPPGGKIILSMSCDAAEIKISVSDTGAGIPKTQYERVFAKFFRAGNIQDDAKGSGLGLYMVKLLLERIGGKIWFESEENKGTTFFVTIPLNK
jgi:signal transduction histidine kinase